MKCSRCYEPIDMDGPCPAFDFFRGSPVCDPCHRGEWAARLSFPEDVRMSEVDSREVWE